jgi:hypothetical protein
MKRTNSELRIVLLTGNELRHRYAAERLSRNLTLLGVASEAKAPVIPTMNSLPFDEQETIHRHFAGRDEVERRLLGVDAGFPVAELFDVPHGSINGPEIFEWVRRLAPDFLLLYGTSIIKAPLLRAYENRIVNLHLGLSPYYRGSGTNFWPLVHGEPECVGATIHLASAKVDAGGILAQVRPEAGGTDRAHELGTKTLMAALDAMPLLLSLYSDGSLEPQAQDLSRGRVFRNRDFNAQAVRAMWANFEAGMMIDYLSRAEARCARFPIVQMSASLV